MPELRARTRVSQIEPAAPISMTCTLAEPFSAEWGSLAVGERSQCGEAAMATITFACAHEHVRQVQACASCATDIQQVMDGLVCWYCREGSQPHECREIVRIEWLSGEITRG